MKSKSEIQRIIQAYLESGCVFRPETIKIEGWQLEGAQETGHLFRTFKLSDCRLWLGVDENGDQNILEVLDTMCKQRRLKVFSARVTRDMSSEDIEFTDAEVGLGVVTPTSPVYGWKFLFRSYYWDKPFPVGELKGCLQPSVIVRGMRKRFDDYLKAKHGGGSREREIEKELYHEGLVANVEQANLLHTINEKLDKLGESQSEKE